MFPKFTRILRVVEEILSTMFPKFTRILHVVEEILSTMFPKFTRISCVVEEIPSTKPNGESKKLQFKSGAYLA